MKIIWQDTDLKRHTIDLSKAVYVGINGIKISDHSKGVRISGNESINIQPIAANVVVITEKEF